MLFSLLMLAVGVTLLFFAGDIFVKGAVGLAENLGISPLIIGLTVVAFGTSAPELFTSVQAALSGAPGLAVGNVVGSNIANVLLVLGVPALIYPVISNEKGLRRNLVAMLGTTAVFMWMLAGGVITRLEGAALFAGLCAFIAWQIYDARSSGAPENHDFHDDIGEAPHDRKRVIIYLVAGVVGLPIAAQLTVAGAVRIAESFGVSDAAIGLTIVAIGTSLPELATSVAAAIKRQSTMALGNIVGSNIFNIACIMGLTALITPVAVDPRIISVDMWVMLGASLALALLGFLRLPAGKAVGGAMLAAFAGYIATVF
ncbi:calcium/sodium antiporter [Nitratireductor aquimarinus]|uniref:calcium/sodium antiporter n=1 Tax=Alphaproteobacteria TaxID=28211 RepID=UPI0019D33816|nr:MULTISPECIES: calcium/sodium antiporter [Alphaproteobacteria]MBN7756093.1 calcium/sodium antiporter [Nitratireductor aquimarinus]MBY5998851.1 calcium/sodium antiporter [Tritonibacter mobilis]MBY6020879.1 calcium/sodium antiporter [Nitratireductor sp. DP7N14-4]